MTARNSDLDGSADLMETPQKKCPAPANPLAASQSGARLPPSIGSNGHKPAQAARHRHGSFKPTARARDHRNDRRADGEAGLHHMVAKRHLFMPAIWTVCA